eukprot:scaffold90756_cov63-Phaeocystis_antarctica.AAC.3
MSTAGGASSARIGSCVGASTVEHCVHSARARRVANSTRYGCRELAQKVEAAARHLRQATVRGAAESPPLPRLHLGKVVRAARLYELVRRGRQLAAVRHLLLLLLLGATRPAVAVAVAVAVCYRLPALWPEQRPSIGCLGGKERDGKQACAPMIVRANQGSDHKSPYNALDGASGLSFFERAFVLQEGRRSICGWSMGRRSIWISLRVDLAEQLHPFKWMQHHFLLVPPPPAESRVVHGAIQFLLCLDHAARPALDRFGCFAPGLAFWFGIGLAVAHIRTQTPRQRRHRQRRPSRASSSVRHDQLVGAWGDRRPVASPIV